MQIKVNRSAYDLKDLEDNSPIEKVIEEHNNVVKLLNFVLKALSFQSNFNGYIASVKIPATSSIKIQHFLGVIPKYRIILRQEGNGVISDIPSGWNTEFITLQNNGSVEVSLTVLIARE